MIIDYLALGHITRDLLPDDTTMPGGTVVFAARTAAALGQRVGVVSVGAPGAEDLPQGVLIHCVPGTPPTFENRYTATGRTQFLHAAGAPLMLDNVPQNWRTAPIVHLAPVAAEIPASLVHAFPGALIGVTPQGWMRAWDVPLPAPVRAISWEPTAALLARVDAIILSTEDINHDERLAAGWAHGCRVLVLTRGAAGATVFLNGTAHHIPAVPVIERHPTGAGDVFAAAFFVHLRTHEPLTAATRAAALAAQHVRGNGPG